MLSVGVFSTVCDTEALALLESLMKATRSGKIEAKVPWIFCNKLPIHTMERLMQIMGEDSTPILWRDSGKFKPELWQSDRETWRELYDQEVLWQLQRNTKPDIIVSVGYMLKVSELLCDAFNILNLHPALPWGPKGTWRQVTKQVVDEGIKATGTMMHLVIEELDAGPAVTYSEVDVEGCDFAEVRKRQFEQEEPLMLATLEGYAKGRFRIGDKAVNLTLEVEALIREKHENERL